MMLEDGLIVEIDGDLIVVLKNEEKKPIPPAPIVYINRDLRNGH